MSILNPIKMKLSNTRINYLLLFIFLLTCQLSFGQNPVNPKASPEAKVLLAYIYSLNDQILTGQHNYNREPNKYMEVVKEMTGKTPAVWGSDLNWSNGRSLAQDAVNTAIERHKEGHIITLMWHVGRPMDTPPFLWKENVQAEMTDKEWKEFLTPGTELNKKWLVQVDEIAGYLKQLQAKNIPVLWRPYHEMNGVWFWWGDKKGEEGYQKLWKSMYDRFTNHHKLNNLLWVWNANAPRDIPEDEAFSYKDFYPGHDFVDILATDVYHSDYEQKDYNELLNLAEGKPIALGEVGTLPKVNILKYQPKWKWFMVWSSWIETDNKPEQVKAIYQDEKAISLEDLQQKR
jgi:mannan endo-1,4-beta-mannosidase